MQPEGILTNGCRGVPSHSNSIRNIVLGLTWQRMPMVEHVQGLSERMALAGREVPDAEIEASLSRLAARLDEPQPQFHIPELDSGRSSVLERLQHDIAKAREPDEALGGLLKGDSDERS